MTFTPHRISECETAVPTRAKPNGQYVVSRLILLQAASEAAIRSASPKVRIKTARRLMTQQNSPLLQELRLHTFLQPLTSLIMTDSTTHPACKHHHLAARRQSPAPITVAKPFISTVWVITMQQRSVHTRCKRDSVAAHQHSADACEHSKKLPAFGWNTNEHFSVRLRRLVLADHCFRTGHSRCSLKIDMRIPRSRQSHFETQVADALPPVAPCRHAFSERQLMTRLLNTCPDDAACIRAMPRCAP